MDIALLSIYIYCPVIPIEIEDAAEKYGMGANAAC